MKSSNLEFRPYSKRQPKMHRAKSIAPSFRFSQQSYYHRSGLSTNGRRMHTQRTLINFGLVDEKNIQMSKCQGGSSMDLEFKQRRLSCCCSECGQFTKKMKKYHDILLSNPNIIDPAISASPQNSQSIRALFTKVAKKTRLCISMKTVQSEKVEKIEKVEFSPEPFDMQCKLINRKNLTAVQLPKISPQIQDYKRKMHNLNNLIEHTQSMPMQSCQIRNSAPNLDCYEKPCKQSPKSKREFSRSQKRNVYLIKPTLNGFSKFRDLKLIKQQ